MDNKYNEEFFKSFQENYMNERQVLQRREEKQRIRLKERQRKTKKRRRIVIFTAVLLVLTITVALVYPKAGEPLPSTAGKEDIPASNSSQQEEPQSLYAKVTENTVSLNSEVESEYALLINVKSNEIVAQKDSEKTVYPASLTKVMTLLVAAENIKDLNATFAMTQEIADEVFLAGASTAGFLVGEEVTVEDLLYGTILPSGADATISLAHHISGSEEEFVKLMNKKAYELGLKSLNFCNTSGLHEDNHYCTLADIAVIMREAMKNSICRKVLTSRQYRTSATPEHPDGIMLTGNMFQHLPRKIPEAINIIAGKTGFTSNSGNCLVSYAILEDGSEYIAVTAKVKGVAKSINDHITLFSSLIY